MIQREDAPLTADEAAREFDWATLPPCPSAGEGTTKVGSPSGSSAA